MQWFWVRVMVGLWAGVFPDIVVDRIIVARIVFRLFLCIFIPDTAGFLF